MYLYTLIGVEDRRNAIFAVPVWTCKMGRRGKSSVKRGHRTPSLSVGRGEKLSVAQGGGLTAKVGRAKSDVPHD